MKKIIFILAGLLLTSVSCNDPEPEPVYGCTDNSAINSSYTATVDDGSCVYSNFVFYARYSHFYDGFINHQITSVDVYIDGIYTGSTGGVIYPTSPNNCFANGTVKYSATNGNTISWNATLYLSNGQQIYCSGTTRSNKFNECIKINVTNI